MLYEKGIDQVIRMCVLDFEQVAILREAQEGLARGHFLGEARGKKISQVGL